MYYSTDTWDGEISLYSVPPGGLKAMVKNLHILLPHSVFTVLSFTQLSFSTICIFHTSLYALLLHISGCNSDKLHQSGNEPACGLIPLGRPHVRSPLSVAPRWQPSSSSSYGAIIVTLTFSRFCFVTWLCLASVCVASAYLCMKIKAALVSIPTECWQPSLICLTKICRVIL